MRRTKQTDLEAARKELADALAERDAAEAGVTAMESALQAALTDEATGKAKPGAARLAKDRVADAELMRDLAAAKVKARETALTQAQDRDDRRQAEALAAEIAASTRRQDELLGEIAVAAEALVARLSELAAVNERGHVAFRARLQIAERLDLPVQPAFNRRRIAFGDDIQEPLARIIADRGTQLQAGVKWRP